MIDSDKQALLNNTCTVPTKIIVDNGDGTTTTLTESDYVLDWNYEDFRYVPNEGFLGQFVERVLTGNLKNVNDSFSIVDKKIELKFGITTVNNNVETTNWYSLGHFIVNQPSDDNVKDKTQFKAVDYTKYFETPYEDLLTYPTTAGCVAYSCCNQANVQLDGFTATLTSDVTIDVDKQYFVYDSESQIYNYVVEPNVADIGTYYELSFDFKNSDFIIDGNPFVNDETNRIVMKWIGNLAFSWVRIDWDDKCHIDYTQETTVDEYDEIDNDHYYDLTTTGTTFGEVNKVVIGMKDVDGENVVITDPDTTNPNECEIALWDNPLTYTEEKRTEAINAGEDLFGLKYQEIESTTIGHPWLKGKEKIKFIDMENNDIYTYPFDRTIIYNGHIKTKIKAPAMSITNTKYTYEGDVKKGLRNTQIQVDKANGQIASLVTETQQLNDTVVEIGTTQTQSIENFEYQITQLNNTVSETTENLQEQIDEVSGIPEQLQNTLVTININGITVATNLSKVSTIVTNNTFAVQDNYGNYLTYIGYDETEGRSKAEMDNLTVTNFFMAGVHRQQVFEIDSEERTGWFYLGGS